MVPDPLLRSILHNTCHTTIALYEYKYGTEEASPATMVITSGIYMLCYLRVATERRRSSYQTQRAGTRKYMHIYSQRVNQRQLAEPWEP